MDEREWYLFCKEIIPHLEAVQEAEVKYGAMGLLLNVSDDSIIASIKGYNCCAFDGSEEYSLRRDEDAIPYGWVYSERKGGANGQIKENPECQEAEAQPENHHGEGRPSVAGMAGAEGK